MKRFTPIAVALVLVLCSGAPALAQSANLLNNGRAHPYAGVVAGSGAVALYSSDSWLDIGRYEFGWTIMTPYRLEMHPGKEFSVSCYGSGCLPKFQVRNIGDTAGAIWLNGNNIIGSQFGPIRFAIGSYNDGGTEIARFEQNGDLTLLNDLIIENQSLTARLSDMEARLSALEAAQ